MKQIAYGFALAVVFAPLALNLSAAPPDASVISVLIIDGQNNHKWQETTPLIAQTLEGCGRFRVTVATSPARGEDMSGFDPTFANYDVVLQRRALE